MDIEYILTELRNHKQLLLDKYHLNSIAVFGSYSRGEENTDSDIDIMVDIGGDLGIEFVELADELEKILNQSVDLVSRSGVKPKYMEYIKPDLIYA